MSNLIQFEEQEELIFQAEKDGRIYYCDYFDGAIMLLNEALKDRNNKKILNTIKYINNNHLTYKFNKEAKLILSELVKELKTIIQSLNTPEEEK
tara:strand:- start:59 stop:340 length:282 start_codon:yes stop_codon:yes gene_type:complete